MEKKSFVKRFLGHLGTVLTHKKWVFHFAVLFGIPWRGLVHDLSKFSPIEFFEGVKYWTGKGSPITLCKADTGLSRAWLHHKGRNKHHFQYWMDYANGVTTYCKMPYNDVLELLADWYGAAVAYSKDTKDLYVREWEWWQKARERDKDKMNQETYNLINYLIWMFSVNENNVKCFRKDQKEVIRKWYDKGIFIESVFHLVTF